MKIPSTVYGTDLYVTADIIAAVKLVWSVLQIAR